jgi:hypothetical protein
MPNHLAPATPAAKFDLMDAVNPVTGGLRAAKQQAPPTETII